MISSTARSDSMSAVRSSLHFSLGRLSFTRYKSVVQMRESFVHGVPVGLSCPKKTSGHCASTCLCSHGSTPAVSTPISISSLIPVEHSCDRADRLEISIDSKLHSWCMAIATFFLATMPGSRCTHQSDVCVAARPSGSTVDSGAHVHTSVETASKSFYVVIVSYNLCSNPASSCRALLYQVPIVMYGLRFLLLCCNGCGDIDHA
nr:hypothetical protein CFP56_22278 [Quercus suber]